MGQIKIGKTVIESLIGMGVSLVVGVFVKKLKDRRKEEDIDKSPMGDLTVEEYSKLIRKIFKEEMEA